MNCDMDNSLDFEDYLNDDRTMWWFDVQQILLRLVGEHLILRGQKAWGTNLDGVHEMIEAFSVGLAPLVNVTDPIVFTIDETPSHSRLDVEILTTKLASFGIEFFGSALRYRNGENFFDDDELLSLVKKDSPRFLPRLMEFHMRDAIQENFFHSLLVAGYASAVAQNRSEWSPAVQSGPGTHSTPKPAPQPYGVSHEGAETLVRDWMLYLGIPSSEVTRLSGDGGIDVTSSTYVAQVKNYRDLVGVQAVREILGVAVGEGKKPLFFTSGSYTSEALAFAEKAGVPLFIYDAAAGSLLRINGAAEHIFEQKNNVSEEEIIEGVRENLLECRVLAAMLQGANRTTSRYLNYLFTGNEETVSEIKNDINEIEVPVASIVDAGEADNATHSLSELLLRFEDARNRAKMLGEVNGRIQQLAGISSTD